MCYIQAYPMKLISPWNIRMTAPFLTNINSNIVADRINYFCCFSPLQLMHLLQTCGFASGLTQRDVPFYSKALMLAVSLCARRTVKGIYSSVSSVAQPKIKPCIKNQGTALTNGEISHPFLCSLSIPDLSLPHGTSESLKLSKRQQ